MPTTVTPLRYPGGKTQLYSVVKDILVKNHLKDVVYCEPFAGGCGLALKLLLNGDVSRIIINDVDRAIYSFWYAVLHNSEELCTYIDGVEITIDEHERCKEVYFHDELYSDLELAKATLFLNRTNVSGVLKGGVIGGQKQDGHYKMDVRFTKETLKRKIRNIAAWSNKIELHKQDVFNFLDEKILKVPNLFINFDPPYVEKGGELYLNHFSENTHERLRKVISKIRVPWIVTYDDHVLIKKLYSRYECKNIGVHYSVKNVRIARELLFSSKDIVL